MDNPVLNDTQALAAEAVTLREQAAASDAGTDTSSATPEPESRASGTEAPAEKTPAAPKVEGEQRSDNPENKTPADKPQEQEQQQTQERGEDGKFVPKKDEKEPSKYEKAKQREAEAWKKINDEKAALAREREEVARLRQQPRQPEAKPALKDERGYTAADYEEAAKGFDESGDEELAKAARQAAVALKQKEVQAVQNNRRQQIEQTRKADLETVLKAHPEFAPGGAKAAQMAELLGEFPELDSLPNCFTRAAQLFQLREEAASVPGLKERAEKAEKEVERLTKLTSINGGSPVLPAGTKKFDDMTLEQQRDWLRRDAAQTQMAA